MTAPTAEPGLRDALAPALARWHREVGCADAAFSHEAPEDVQWQETGRALDAARALAAAVESVLDGAAQDTKEGQANGLLDQPFPDDDPPLVYEDEGEPATRARAARDAPHPCSVRLDWCQGPSATGDQRCRYCAGAAQDAPTNPAGSLDVPAEPATRVGAAQDTERPAMRTPEEVDKQFRGFMGQMFGPRPAAQGEPTRHVSRYECVPNDPDGHAADCVMGGTCDLLPNERPAAQGGPTTRPGFDHSPSCPPDCTRTHKWQIEYYADVDPTTRRDEDTGCPHYPPCAGCRAGGVDPEVAP